MSEYKPELGQAIFGNTFDCHDCPRFIEAGLEYLLQEVNRVMWNNTQEEYNAGRSDNYKTDVFEVRRYYWGDDDDESDLPNFKCGDFELRWYKHPGRGMSMNKSIDANQFAEIIHKCLKDTWGKEK